ncbi:MAG: diguanylate cyclase [Pseudomonadota bacterium]
MTTPQDPTSHVGLLSSAQRNLLIAACALLVTVFFALGAWQDYQAVKTRLRADAERAVNLASNEINHYLEDQRRLLRVFTRDRQPLIEAVADHPSDAASREALRQRVHDCFPEAFAFNLIDAAGKERGIDFEGLIGDLCRANISEMAHTGVHQPLMAHPHPQGYHFDIMSPWKTSAGHCEIFFLSFTLTRLARILELNENLGLKLYLLRTDVPGLIEVANRGSRLELDRSDHLSSDELGSIHARQFLPDSLWELVALPDTEALSSMTSGIVGGLLRSVIILWMVALVLALLLSSKERQLAARRASENALRESNRELYQRATHDGLTGLANRPSLNDALERALRLSAREQSPLSIAMIDIDHFKAYNDGLGHLAGDECLRQVADILRMSCQRPDDLVGRVGGEEFMVILPDTPLEVAETKLELAQSRLAQRNLPHPRGGQVTFSAGIACLIHDHRPNQAEALVEVADKALYRAKRAGRNRIESVDLRHTPDDQTSLDG